MAKKSEYPRLSVSKKVIDIIEDSNWTQSGQLDVFEAAFGALIIGESFGWRVLYLVHTHSTLQRYCQVLGIKSFKDHCPEVGPYAMRCNGFRWAQKIGDYWAAIKGEESLPHEERLKVVST